MHVNSLETVRQTKQSAFVCMNAEISANIKDKDTKFGMLFAVYNVQRMFNLNIGYYAQCPHKSIILVSLTF